MWEICLMCSTGERARVEMPKIPAQFTGTGDLFAALLLAWGQETLQVSKYTLSKIIILLLCSTQTACEKTVSTMHSVLQRTLKHALGKKSLTYCIPVIKWHSQLPQNCQAVKPPIQNRLNSDWFKAKGTLRDLLPSALCVPDILYSLSWCTFWVCKHVLHVQFWENGALSSVHVKSDLARVVWSSLVFLQIQQIWVHFCNAGSIKSMGRNVSMVFLILSCP